MTRGHVSTIQILLLCSWGTVSQQEKSRLGSQCLKAASENIVHSKKWKAFIHTLKYFYYCAQLPIQIIQIQHAATGIYDLVQSQPLSEQACI